jgi:sterol 14-demethylase
MTSKISDEVWNCALLSIPSTTVLIVFLVLLIIIYYLFWNNPTNAPPCYSILLSILSGKYDFANKGPLKLIQDGYQSVGEIFRIQLLHQSITFLIGPQAHKVFFEAKDTQLSQREVYTFTVPVFGKNIVYDAPPKIMQQQLKFVNKGLNQINMTSHVDKIIMEAEEWFDKWPESGQIDLMKELSELIILTASRCLLGKEIRENVHSEFAHLYQQLSDGMSHLSFFFPNAPTQAHKQRNAARVKIGKIFEKVIKARRIDKETDYDDYLQVLIDARYMDNSLPTDDEITGLLLAALFAGQHTSNITSTWMGLLLMENKSKWIPRLLNEQKQIMEEYHGELSLNSLDEMILLHAAMKETLRMHPPLILLMRKVLEPISYNQYVIPKGDIAVVSPSVAHRLSDVFKNPDEFNPDRFLGENAEDQIQKFSFVAFGAGRHGCLGEKFAYLQVKTIWSILLRKFDFDLCQQHPKPDYSTLVVGPKPPCIIKFRRKTDPYTFNRGKLD